MPLTWTNAVEIMIPVPNCLMRVNANPFMLALKNRDHMTGPKTASALLARITKREPMRRGIL